MSFYNSLHMVVVVASSLWFAVYTTICYDIRPKILTPYNLENELVKRKNSSTICCVRVIHTSNGTSSEHHLILSQCSCFIREHKLDLTEILRDIESTASHGSVSFLMVQIEVIVDHVHLSPLDQFNRHIQTYRDENLKR